MRKLKSKISASFKSKRINVFLLFLLCSFLILIFSKLSKEYTKTVAFEIEKLNLPEEKVILRDSILINITLKTHGFRWLKYSFDKPKIKIDFSKDVIQKESVYVWNKSVAYLNNTQFDKQVQLLSITPDTLVFRYGVNMVKKVPVKLNADIKFGAGYNTINPIEIEPDSVLVIGPHVLVSEIDLLETEDVILNDIRTDLNVETKLKLPKSSTDLKFSDANITLKANVEKFTEGTLKVPVRIINVPNGINLKYFPKEVNVSYYVSLKNFKSIKLNDFKVVCDYSKIIENQSFLVPELLQFPKTVKNAKINQQQIEFIISK
ncbi:YbbR-like domain-containing protein [Seonamhaeicola sediminis]|uniref:YbbR-like domain-containing protein n=1 Tax=Seonamhaeicola sediminis TaxID=2528206 RepID=A0A562YBK8_9FLAO|nr:YbbR-like domain-containing protein [Seonamhaeicola sediminis]